MSDFENLLNFNSNENETTTPTMRSKFPTSGLKSLLQNSDLLELLLKPLSNEKSDDETTTTTTTTTEASSMTAPSSDVVVTLDDDDPGIDLINPTQLENLADFNLIDASKSKSLFDWETSDEYLQMKSNKIGNSDGENSSKIYGNAFLGPNLWDKNDLFQGEKFGVKFEYLEIDEFLNENGLNETDVEFLDQIQKIDNMGNMAAAATATGSNVGGAGVQQSQQNNNVIQSSNISPMSKSPAVSSVSSPSASSSSSSSSSSGSTSPSIQSSSSSSGGSSRPSNQLDLSSKERNQLSNNNNGSKNPASRSNSLSLVSQQHNYSLPGGVNTNKTHTTRKDSLSNGADTSLPSSGGHNQLRSSLNDSSFDWNSNSNDMSVMSEDFDDFDPKTRKFSDDDLRPLPVLRKSKKTMMMMANTMKTNKANKCSSSSNSSSKKMTPYSTNLFADPAATGEEGDDLSESLLDSSFMDESIDDSDLLHFSKTGGRNHQFVPSEMKDEKYWHRRKKNNIAAKRSRDARRMKENQIAIRASYLERENDLLRKQLDDFKRETKLLKIKLTRYESLTQQQQQQQSGGLLDLSAIDDSK